MSFIFNADNYDAVIFDLDGSLVDSMWMWKSIDTEYLAELGYEVPSDLQLEIEGLSFYDTADYFKKRFNINNTLEEIGDKWNKMAWDKYTNEVPLKKGVKKFLELCFDKGIKFGIASSNSKELIEQVLKSRGVDCFFSTIKSGSEGYASKPSPELYLAAARDLEVDPERCLVFEDITQGIMAGKNAGMTVIAVDDEYSAYQEKEKRDLADHYICDYDELIEMGAVGV
ncbi:MAG: HAD family phosphatase [Butyrivibrio sp.]|nr:HAD family phosphatase [Butyrivibrio sp.]